MLEYLYCHPQTLEILINKQYLIAEYQKSPHLPLSPTKERMSSNVLALVAILPEDS